MAAPARWKVIKGCEHFCNPNQQRVKVRRTQLLSKYTRSHGHNFPTTFYQKERKTRLDDRDSQIVNFAQLAADLRGRGRVEGKKDQC